MYQMYLITTHKFPDALENTLMGQPWKLKSISSLVIDGLPLPSNIAYFFQHAHSIQICG